MAMLSTQTAIPASLPQAGQVWRYVCNVNPLSTISDSTQVDQSSSESLDDMNQTDTEAVVHSETNADSMQLAISAALADSFKLASSTQLASSGLVPASLEVVSAGVKQHASASGDNVKAESATLATIVWPGSTPPEATSSTPQPTVCSPDDGSPRSPRSPPTKPNIRGMLSKQYPPRQLPAAVPEITSDEPVGFTSPNASTIDLYPVAPRTPPNNSLYVSQTSSTSPTKSPVANLPPTSPFKSSKHPTDSFNPPGASRTPLSARSHSSSRSPLPRSSSFTSQPHDLSPASARGTWVRREVRRSLSRTQLGAERVPSRSPSRHTPAASGVPSRSPGSTMMRSSHSAIELSSITPSQASSVDVHLLPAPDVPPVRTGRDQARRADSDAGNSRRSLTPPGSVAGSSFAVSPRLPWAPRGERKQPVKLGATSRSPARFQRHPPAALVSSSSFLDDYEDNASIMRLRRRSVALGTSASAVDMIASPSAVGGASFFSGAAGGMTVDGSRIAPPSEAGSMMSGTGRRMSLAMRLSGGHSRTRYLRTLYMSTTQSTMPAAPDPPPGVPSLNFRKYDFALSRQFTFSDGRRICMHDEA